MASKKRAKSLGPGLRWRGGVIWMRSVRKGNAFNVSTGTTDPDVARLLLSERLVGGSQKARSEAAHAARARLPRLETTVEGLAAWHAAALVRRSEGHRRGASYGWIGGLIPYFSGRRIDNLRRQDLVDYVVHRMGDGQVGGNTVRREVGYLVRALKHLVDETDADVRVPAKPDPREYALHEVKLSQAGHHLEDEVLIQLLAEVSPACRRWVLMLLATGMRQEELRRVTPDMLRRAPRLTPDGGILDLPAHATKTRRARTLFLPEWAYQTFVSGPLPFVYHSHLGLSRAANRLGLPRQVFVHDRSFRKTFASRAKEETGDEVAVDIAMGHMAKGTQGRYQDLTEYRAYAVGRAVTVRFGALMRALGLPAKPWPARDDWARQRPTPELASPRLRVAR